MRLRNLAIIAVLSIASLAQQTNGPSRTSIPLSPERAVKFRRPSDLHFSPDGSRFVCVVSEANGPTIESHLWLLHVGQGERELHQFTFSQKSERSPQWGPDGSGLAFLSNRAGPMQVYVMPPDRGEAHAVTASAIGVSNFHWSPDGKQIAFLAREPESEQGKKDNDAQIADREQDLERLWMVDLASRKTRQITNGPWRIDDFDWSSPDRILAMASDHPKAETWNDALYSISLTDATTTLVAKPNQPFGGLLVAPGRRQFSFISTRAAGPIPHDLFLQTISGGPAHDATSAIDRAVIEARWQNDSTILVRVADGFRNRIFRIDSNGLIAAIDLPYSVRAFDVAPDGTLIFAGVGFNRLPELFIRRIDGTIGQVTHLQKEEGWDGVQLADAEIFRFKSFDGREIEAALMKPIAQATNGKPPLVLLVHGGPASNFSADYFWFNAWPQLLVARGYQVLMVNPRGSTGYGENFLKANRADWGGGDFKDLMAALDAVIARGETDPNRLGIGGWSYGGEMTQWAITQTNRFRAAVTGGGVFDQAAEFGTEDDPAADEWYFGTPWDNPEVFARNSPATFIRNAKTPMLIVHGEDDHNNPVIQSRELYRALKRYGVESELIVYPGEGHLPHQEKHQIDILQRMLDWFDHYLK
jgi:dipeptidyl aminopeptidase/acylaminoacyl peptidase